MTCCSRCWGSAKRGPHSVATNYVMHFDSAAELHRIDDLRARFKPAQLSPPAPDAQAALVDHASIPSRVRHPFVGSIEWRTVGEARPDRFGLFRLPREPLPNFATC